MATYRKRFHLELKTYSVLIEYFLIWEFYEFPYQEYTIEKIYSTALYSTDYIFYFIFLYMYCKVYWTVLNIWTLDKF